LLAETIWSNAQLLPPFEVNKIHMINLAVDVVKLGCTNRWPFLLQSSTATDIPFVDIATALSRSTSPVTMPPALCCKELAAAGQVGTRARVKANRAAIRFAMRVVGLLDPFADALARFVDAPLRLGPAVVFVGK
jgi:hypothetical protein